MGVMIPMKRERMLTIRVTDDEHARLLERCEGKQLAVWMRRVCLGEPVARSGKLPTLAPPLLRQLAAIGNNLNQTARKVNSGQWSSGDRVQVVAALMAIGDELRRKTTVRCSPYGLSGSGYSRWQPDAAAMAVPVSAVFLCVQPAPPDRPAASIPPVVYPRSVPVTGRAPHR